MLQLQNPMDRAGIWTTPKIQHNWCCRRKLCSEAQFEESLSHVHFAKVQTVSIVHVIKIKLLKPNTSAFTSPHASVHPMQLTSPGCHPPGLSVAAGRWQPPPRPGRPRPWHWHRHSTVARRFERRRWQHPHPPGQVGWIQWRLWTLVVQCGIMARLKWRIQFLKQIKFQIFIYIIYKHICKSFWNVYCREEFLTIAHPISSSHQSVCFVFPPPR